jgi:hypothetical protein
LPRNKRRPLRGGLLDEFFQASGEIYRSDVRRVVRGRCQHRPQPHRLDEFPTGYSSAGYSPTEPASASPVRNHSALKLSFRSSVFHRTANRVLTVCLSPGGHRRTVYTGFLSVEIKDSRRVTLWSYLVKAGSESQDISKDLSKRIAKHLAAALDGEHPAPINVNS